MKIGEFAELCGTSRDTVRFYISKGLLLPDTRGSQMQFSDHDVEEMHLILRMKSLSFSLDEIRKYLTIMRISNMVEPESILEASDILECKRDELELQIENLRKIQYELSQDIDQLKKHIHPAEKTGLPLRALPLLTCPHCGKTLQLSDASLDTTYIYQGQVQCGCGYQAVIEDGILKTGNLYTGSHDHPDVGRGLYRSISEDFDIYMQRCNQRVIEELRKRDLHGKVLLEAHLNGYFLLYNNITRLDPDCTYILVDRYPEVLARYKQNIEQLGLRLHILYIADNSMDWPIQQGCVDYVLSGMDDTEHSLYFPSSYINDVQSFLKEDAQVIGIRFGYKEGAKSLSNLRFKYPEGDCEGFRWQQVCREYQRLGYTYHSELIGEIEKCKDAYSFACQEEGEKLIIGFFLAQKRGE